jgi:beta-lactamase class A
MAFGHAAAAQSRANDLLGQVILDAEARLKARLGVAILDTETGRRWQHRADERFPMCSTFKGLAGAAVLALVDGGREDLGRRIVFQEDELVTYSPVTKDRIGGAGMTIGELCEATITTSDNTAGNLVLRVIGGPDGLTRFLRSTGDAVTRLDRWETALNEARPGDPRDTTTPAAMTDTMGRLVLGDVLSASSRDRLTAWLVGNTVSGPKLKAGLPHEWRVADRTGGGGFGTNNVTGLVWPPGSRPILVSIFITETVAPAAESNAAMADLARTLHTTLAG